VKTSAIIALSLSLLAAPSFADAQPPAPATSATRVVVNIRSDDAALGPRLQKSLEDELKLNPGYALDGRAPLGGLIIYANTDANDRKNPNGVTLAIAIVTNAPTYYLAVRLLPDGPNQTKDPEVRKALTSMVQQAGFLQTLNTAHLDEATDEAIAQTARSIVAQFTSKIPPNAGG
jgi:hypothetical protein